MISSPHVISLYPIPELQLLGHNLLPCQRENVQILIFYQFQRYRIGGNVQDLLGISVITIGNGKIYLTIQVIRVVNEEDFVAVDVALSETCNGGIRMKL